MTDTLTSKPSSPSLPSLDELLAPGAERDDEAVSEPPELDELPGEELPDELLELGMDGIDPEEDEELGIEGIDAVEDEDELGIEGDDGDEDEEDELGIEGDDGDEDEEDELGIDGIEDELLELDWVDSQPLRTRPSVMALTRTFSEGKTLGEAKG